MSVEQQTQRVLYQGNGTATEFPFTFSVYAANQVRVVTATADGIETERTYNNEFSVSLASSGSGGTVTYPVSGDALAVGEKIAVISAIPSTQEKTFPNNTPFYQEQIEGALDKNTRLVQQLEELSVRAVKIPETSSDDPAELIQAVYTARSDAQTSAANAAASETNAVTSETNAAASASAASDTLDNAVTTISAAQDTAVAAVSAEGATQTAAATAQAQAAAGSATDAAASATLAQAWAAQAETDVSAAVEQVNEAGATQIAAVQAEGATQIAEIDAVATTTPTAGSVPKTGAGTQLAVGWIPGVFTGDIRFLPFRADALPDGWYCMNGELYPVTGGPGAALLALPETFRTDWGIALSEDGTTVNVPDWFAEDGRGPIMRAVDGTLRQTGSLENDGLPDIVGELASPQFGASSGAMSLSESGYDLGSGGRANYSKMSFSASRSNPIYGSSSYVQMLNRGMTPAIFLGA